MYIKTADAITDVGKTHGAPACTVSHEQFLRWGVDTILPLQVVSTVYHRYMVRMWVAGKTV